MTRLPLLALLLVLPAASAAQVRIGPNGIHSGDTAIDATGVHTDGADVTTSGVRTNGRGGVVIVTNGGTRSVDCHGGRLTLNGNRNRLDVANCTALTIAGNDNEVAARFAGSGTIAVPGNHNRIAWRAAPRANVSVNNLGTGNAVAGR